MDAKLWISNILIALLLIIIAPNGHILANIAIVSQLSLAIDLSSKGLPGQLRYLVNHYSVIIGQLHLGENPDDPRCGRTTARWPRWTAAIQADDRRGQETGHGHPEPVRSGEPQLRRYGCHQQELQGSGNSPQRRTQVDA